MVSAVALSGRTRRMRGRAESRRGVSSGMDCPARRGLPAERRTGAFGLPLVTQGALHIVVNLVGRYDTKLSSNNDPVTQCLQNEPSSLTGRLIIYELRNSDEFATADSITRVC